MVVRLGGDEDSEVLEEGAVEVGSGGRVGELRMASSSGSKVRDSPPFHTQQVNDVSGMWV